MAARDGGETATRLREAGIVRVVLTALKGHRSAVSLQLAVCRLVAVLASGFEELRKDLVARGAVRLVQDHKIRSWYHRNDERYEDVHDALAALGA